MHRIQLGNNVFEGRNNAYVLGVDGDAPTTLVDTGVSMPEIRAELRGGLADLGLSFADVDRVLLTHWHADHAGLAGEVQAAGGASVHVHRDDAGMVVQEAAALDAFEARQAALFDEWRMPDGPREELLAYFDGQAALRGDPVDVTPFEDGEEFRVGGPTLTAVHLPGHTAGLSAFVADGPVGTDTPGNGRGDAGDGRTGPEAFVGDAVLPKYTPNVGGADVRVDRPLERYLASLERVIEADLARAWPGHRGSIFAPADRARDIVAHHVERTRRTYAVVAEAGPASAWAVSDALFGDLAGIHILHGPGEAHAHLDYLERRGHVESTDEGYVAVDADEPLHENPVAVETGVVGEAE